MYPNCGLSKLVTPLAVPLLLFLPASCERVPPPKERIEQAIKTNDTISAFHDVIYDQYANPMSEVIPVLKDFLSNPDPWIRYQAAEDLYIAGDNSGCDALVEILKNEHPVRGDSGQDLRVGAAQILEKYREKKATSALVYYVRTPKGKWAITGLVRILRSSLPADLIQIIKSTNDQNFIIYTLSLSNPKDAEALAKESFQNPKSGKSDPRTLQIIPAWAMLRAGANEPYFSFLFDLAKKCVAGGPTPKGTDPFLYEDAFKYLASIKRPEVKELLISGLSSKSEDIVMISMLNLIYSQNSPDVPKKLVLGELQGPPYRYDYWDMTMKIAIILNDPKINAAGRAFDRRTEESGWAYYEDRKNWSVYTWIDDYVVDIDDDILK